MAQRYHSEIARERMAAGKCPECGQPAEAHSPDNRFWIPRPFDCSLLPVGVTERIEQYRADETKRAVDKMADVQEGGAP